MPSTTYQLSNSAASARIEATLSSTGEVEFPGIPSTQEWREDFPATQIPPRRPRSPYITPETSFNVPSGEPEIDGFDIQTLAGAPQTPARWVSELQQMPPTPISIKKQSLSSRNENGVYGSPNERPRNEKSALESEVLSASSISSSKHADGALDVHVRRRRRRRRSRWQGHTTQTSPTRLKRDTPNPPPAAPLHSSTPEPWPTPFPQADKGIYPYLPPSTQFEQMVKFTSATEEHIDKWNLHHATYPVPLLRQVLNGQECVHMGLYSQLEHMDKLLEELEKMMRPVSAKERARKGKAGREKYRRVAPQMLERIRFMREMTRQKQVCFYESRLPMRLDWRTDGRIQCGDVDLAV